MKSLKYLSNFWKTLEMPLINCETELILDWSANCVIIYTDLANQVPTFTITETIFMFQQLFYQLKIIQNYYHN